MKTIRVVVYVDGVQVAETSNEVEINDVEHVVSAIVAQVEEPGSDE